jgi:hypothetical protein
VLSTTEKQMSILGRRVTIATLAVLLGSLPVSHAAERIVVLEHYTNFR